mgnify:CR=1 FL=1
MSENIRVLGKISTAFGIKGWVKVYSYTQPMTNILEYPVWHIRKDNRWQEFKVLQGKPQGKGLVASLQAVPQVKVRLAGWTRLTPV